MLEPIHNQSLRSALGAFRTYPASSLHVEAEEPALYSRRYTMSQDLLLTHQLQLMKFHSHQNM